MVYGQGFNPAWTTRKISPAHRTFDLRSEEEYVIQANSEGVLAIGDIMVLTTKTQFTQQECVRMHGKLKK